MGAKGCFVLLQEIEAGSSVRAFDKLSTIYMEGLLHLLQLCNGLDAENGFLQVLFLREKLVGEQTLENKLVLQKLSSYMGITILHNLIMLLERYVASQQSSLHICYLRAQPHNPDNTAYQDTVSQLRCSSCLCKTHRPCQKQCNAFNLILIPCRLNEIILLQWPLAKNVHTWFSPQLCLYMLSC